MAVVRVWLAHEQRWTEPRNFHPPKRADLKYWWKEAKRGQPKLPDWNEAFRTCADITTDTIIWTLQDICGIDVWVARKKHLR